VSLTQGKIAWYVGVGNNYQSGIKDFTFDAGDKFNKESQAGFCHQNNQAEMFMCTFTNIKYLFNYTPYSEIVKLQRLEMGLSGKKL